MLTVYGIKQCDTCRKALKWLEAEGIEHHFVDLRADGLDAERLAGWLASPLAEKVVNRRSTTWRQLDDRQRAVSGTALLRLLVQHPTLIKRPVIEQDGQLLAIGFDPASLQEQL
jgi:Spx/MgsR family transcriptional regulator